MLCNKSTLYAKIRRDLSTVSNSTSELADLAQDAESRQQRIQDYRPIKRRRHATVG